MRRLDIQSIKSRRFCVEVIKLIQSGGNRALISYQQYWINYAGGAYEINLVSPMFDCSQTESFLLVS